MSGIKGMKRKYPMTHETRLKLSLLRRGKKRKPPSESTRQKISLAQKGKPRPNKITDEQRLNMSLCKRGDRTHLWRGGISKYTRTARANLMSSLEYKLWRKSVFERDDYTCIWCGAKSAKGIRVILNADHIKPFAHYPELRLAIDNGRTLCINCHKTTDTFGGKSIKKHD